MNATLENVSENVFRNIYLWAKESVLKSILILFLFTVVGIPTIQYLQNQVRSYPYIQQFHYIQLMLDSVFTDTEIFLLFLIVLLSVSVAFILWKQTYINTFQENFSKGLSEWSIPLNATWTIQRCEDAFGKTLKIINSIYPGTLKPLYGWYDYKINFLSKITKQGNEKSNISVVIRSENNLNGLVLQFSNDYFYPYFLHNGTYILDNANVKKLPTDLSNNEWVKIQIRVKGNNILIDIGGYEIHYSIQTYSLRVKSIDLIRRNNSTLKISDLNESALEVDNQQKEQLRLWQIYDHENDLLKKNKAYEDWDQYVTNEMSQAENVQFEYQKGSVGFFEKSSTPSYYRNLVIKKI